MRSIAEAAAALRGRGYRVLKAAQGWDITPPGRDSLPSLHSTGDMVTLAERPPALRQRRRAGRLVTAK